jgi:hypothetical protein
MFGILAGLERGSKVGRIARGTLSRKHGNKNFYKGTGTRSVGRITSRGKFVVEKDRLIDFQVPDLSDFKVRTRKLIISI